MLWWLVGISRIDLADLGRRMLSADRSLLLLGVGCFLLSIIVIALRYRLFLPPAVGLRYMLGVSLMQQALVTFVPWRLGEASYPLLLRRDHAVPLVQGIAMLVAVRLSDLVVVLGFALIAMIRLGFELGRVMALGAVGLGLTAVMALLAWRLAPMRVLALRHTLIDAYGPLCSPGRQAAFVGLSVAYFALSIVQSSFILSALGFRVHPLDIASLQALSLLFALLPIHPPGGWGTSDTMQVLFFERLGYSAPQVIPVILAAHSVYTVLFAVGGCVGWLLHIRERPAPASVAVRSTK
jgi:uncharacterized membrane protein YbhN (UPF0104 family)